MLNYARAQLVYEMRQSGKTLGEIGVAFGLSGERVRQILLKRDAWAKHCADVERAAPGLDPKFQKLHVLREMTGMAYPTLDAIAAIKATDLARRPNMGRKSIRYVEQWLASHGRGFVRGR